MGGTIKKVSQYVIDLHILISVSNMLTYFWYGLYWAS